MYIQFCEFLNGMKKIVFFKNQTSVNSILP